eukprot:scaffold40554_cov44-Prasinocladus_malaysianus.AAC.1
MTGTSTSPATEATALGGEISRQQRRRRQFIGLVFLVVLLMIATSLVGWTVSYNAGVSSVQVIGQKTEELYPPIIMYGRASNPVTLFFAVD